ncbi:MAG: peptide-N-glycosidase F-related protein [Myxococcota bacterium]
MRWESLALAGLMIGSGILSACSGSTKDADTGQDTSAPALTACEDGVPARPFTTEGVGVQFGEVAGDFTVETLDGSFTLSEAWNGCDTFVVVSYFENAEGDALWSSDPSELLANAPKNSQFLFVSDEGGPARREQRVQAMKDTLNLGKRRADRVHFVLDRVSRIKGGLGDFVADYLEYQADSLVEIDDSRSSSAPLPWFIGIDRFQTWDPGGNIDDVVGGNPQVSFAGFLPQFYNHKAQLAHRLDAETVTEIELVNQEVTERVFPVTVDLPSDISAFDTMEFDVEVTCKARNPFACSEWDRIARIEWCTSETCEERREVARWITPYWRRGNRRWAIDASPFLGLVGSGSQTFRIVMGPDWERATPRDARIALRLSTQGKARASSAKRVFTGGSFDAKYNENRKPVTIDVPAGASKVELVTILSGHGQAAGTNCSEWCDHRHRFSVDGQEAVLIQPEGAVGASLECAPAAAQGVPPGQWGNWAPLRAYWCPGLPVEARITDLTSLVTPGQSASLTYEGFFAGSDVGAGGNIDLSAYVVYYE